MLQLIRPPVSPIQRSWERYRPRFLNERRIDGGVRFWQENRLSLAKASALDLGPYGITVNCLCPGWTNTTLVDFDRIGARSGASAAEARSQAEADNAQHRVLEPEELAPMALLLASDAGAGITGQVINVDGGYRL